MRCRGIKSAAKALAGTTGHQSLGGSEEEASASAHSSEQHDQQCCSALVLRVGGAKPGRETERQAAVAGAGEDARMVRFQGDEDETASISRSMEGSDPLHATMVALMAP